MRRDWRMGLAAVMCVMAALAGNACADGPDVPADKSWAFTYNDHGFAPGSEIDLRSLNENVAGEHGFIRLSADGQSFVRGDGQPIRFWAVNAKIDGTPADIDKEARFLASLGVNLARIFVILPVSKEGAKITDVDQKQINEAWRAESAFKKCGIYSLIVPYWSAAVHPPASWGLPDTAGNSACSLLFFNPQLQDAYKAWIKALYSPTNPYTGIPLAKDPAVAVFQIQNEDGILFWTTQAIKGAQADLLATLFGQWLEHKFGSFDKATARWQGAAEKGDDFAQKRPRMMLLWRLTTQAPPLTGGARVRASDQLEFMTELQRNFYAETIKYYRNALGCRQLINCSNWYSADPVLMNDDERYSNDVGDVMAVNHYYAALHVGKNNGWRIDPGDSYADPTATTDIRNLPCNFKMVVGHPFLVTESTWVNPMSHQTEGPPLMAAYQSLTGMNAYFWFDVMSPEYDTDPYFNFVNLPGGHAYYKWTCTKPEIMGMFPAAALIYRKGYIEAGATPAIHEERSLADMWAEKPPLIAEDASFDPNRWAGKTGSEESNIKGGINPLAFLVGRVEVKYDGIPSDSRAVDFSKYIDSEHKIIHSITGQITMDYGIGLCTVNAPSAVEAIGSLSKAGTVELGDVTIKSGNDYGSVSVVPLDDTPIADSHKILVQVGTWGRPTGWTTEPAMVKPKTGKAQGGFRIIATGHMPERLLNTDLTVSVRNRGLTRAELLDTAGYPIKTIAGKLSDGTLTVTLPADAMYVVLE